MHADVHALRGFGRVGVGGVASEKDVVGARDEGGRDELIDAVNGEPFCVV